MFVKICFSHTFSKPCKNTFELLGIVLNPLFVKLCLFSFRSPTKHFDWSYERVNFIKTMKTEDSKRWPLCVIMGWSD